MAKLNIRVGNIKRGDSGEYIGRSMKNRAGSPLANPYRLKDESQRDMVIRHYRTWLWKKIQARDAKVMAELWRLRDLALRPEGVVLLCWCAPKACHGDVIASALAWLEGRIREEEELVQVATEELSGVVLAG
jgi:hypothetical protein